VDEKQASFLSLLSTSASSISDKLLGDSIVRFAECISTQLGVPQFLIEILLLIEDKRFPQHPGFDYLAILRAIFANPRSDVLQGASTISQQIFTMREVTRSGRRPKRDMSFKVKQLIWAAHHERRHHKAKILSEYLDSVYVGRSHDGVVSGASGYFGVPIECLDPAQAFFLIERIGSPNVVRPARVVNLLNRVQIQEFLIRSKIDSTHVVEVYSSIFGDVPTVRKLQSHFKNARCRRVPYGRAHSIRLERL